MRVGRVASQVAACANTSRAPLTAQLAARALKMALAAHSQKLDVSSLAARRDGGPWASTKAAGDLSLLKVLETDRPSVGRDPGVSGCWSRVQGSERSRPGRLCNPLTQGAS